ncbi:MAG: CusA/CzcA family heavy metal efflux RND transporter [Bacteroidota bacterium]|nr:CusA/CzcA family heavy metal efflux RND transporter [Bacteroidota bacterium]MDP4197073.1 CusA/CzcA family heavy metal efflux RND transporter [Bacteroidota bacterium]
MLRKFVNFALEQRYLTIALALMLVGLGIWAYSQLKVEAYPDVADVEVVIVSQFAGRAAEEVEQQVTLPLERELNSIPHLLTRRSKTIFGLSVIDLTFDNKVDDYFARQLVLEKLRDVDLPDGVQPQLGPLSTPVGEIYRYVLDAPEAVSSMELRTTQDWVIVPKLLQVPGVADVVTFGGLVRQFHIIVNPQKLQDYGLTVSQLMDIIKANNINTGGNILERGAQSLAIRGIGAVTNKKEIENIVLMSRKGVPVLLKDVAAVDIGAMPPSGILGYSIPASNIDHAKAVQGLILMRRGENPNEVLEGIQETIRKINSSLPSNIKINVLYDRRELVDNTLHTVSHTLLEGIIIVMFVIFFFLGNIRAALVTAVTIPLSLLFAFILMNLSGIPANLLSLGAIDFGIIVDGAVIMTENIMRHLKHRKEGQKGQQGTLGTIKDAAKEVERQIFFSVAIIILAYLPLFTLQRVEGKLFSPMAYTLSYAILGSLVFALSLIPVLLSFVLKKKVTEWENPISRKLQSVYEKMLPSILRYKYAIVSLTVLLVTITIIIAGKMGTEFLPNLDEGSVNIRTILATGINLQESAEIANSIRDEISKSPEVKSVISQVGRNEDGTDPYGPNRIETFVGLWPYKQWKAGMTKPVLLKDLKYRLEKRFPGAQFAFSQPILDNVSEAVTGSVADLAVLITGPDLDTLRLIGNSVLNVVKTVKGASEYGIEQEGPQSQLIIRVDREQAARYGINVADIQSIVESALGGKTVSKTFEGEKRFDIVVRYPIEVRSSTDDIGSIILTSPNGEKIPLKALTEIYFADGATMIARQDGQRQISVRTDIDGRDQGGFVKEAQKLVSKKVKLPQGYSIDWGGQFENLTRASHRLMIVVPITVIIIFTILFMLFKQVKYALIVLANVPFALIGGVMALIIRGMNFNVSAGVGFVSLFGVAVMSGVLLISRFNQLRFEQGYPLQEAIIEGARIQLRPILMMMTVALIGLIPAASATGIGSDVQRPLATVIVGGLASALILTLTVLPGLYAIVERNSDSTKK